MKTRLVDARTDGFEFLGYRFEAGKRWPRGKSLAKIRDTILAKTQWTTGGGLAKVIEALNPTRWPNRFFAEHGLFSLQRAYETVRQSPCG